jgi:hypothetical protein
MDGVVQIGGQRSYREFRERPIGASVLEPTRQVPIMKIQPVFVAALPLLLLLGGCGAKPTSHLAPTPRSSRSWPSDKSFAAWARWVGRKGESSAVANLREDCVGKREREIEVVGHRGRSFLGAAALGESQTVRRHSREDSGRPHGDAVPDLRPKRPQTVTSAAGATHA